MAHRQAGRLAQYRLQLSLPGSSERVSTGVRKRPHKSDRCQPVGDIQDGEVSSCLYWPVTLPITVASRSQSKLQQAANQGPLKQSNAQYAALRTEQVSAEPPTVGHPSASGTDWVLAADLVRHSTD